MLEINATAIVAMISFIIFMCLMNVILYKPMREIVERRKNFIESNDNEIAANKEKTEELIGQRDKEIDEARVRSRNIIADITTQAKQESAATVAEAAKQTNEYLKNTFSELDGNVNQIKHEIKSEVVGLAQDILSKVSGENITLNGVSDEEYEKVINNGL